MASTHPVGPERGDDIDRLCQSVSCTPICLALEDMSGFRSILVYGAILLSDASRGAFGFAPSTGNRLHGLHGCGGRRRAAAGSDDNDNSAKVESAASSKSNEEVDFITTAILKNSLFGGLSETSLKLLVSGFELSEASRGAELVTQGDSCTGDYVYLLSDGECKVIVDGQIVPEPYGTIKPASVFGEQGFLYDEPRAATVRARSDTVLYYKLRGELFAEVMAKPKEELAGMRAIDEAINQVSGTDSLYGGAVILPYKPERMWLWRQFDGTVLKISIRPTLLNMALCVAFVMYARHATGEDIFEVGAGAPDKSLPFVQNLEMFGKVCTYMTFLSCNMHSQAAEHSFTDMGSRKEPYNIYFDLLFESILCLLEQGVSTCTGCAR